MESHLQSRRGGKGKAENDKKNWKVMLDKVTVGRSHGDGCNREICEDPAALAVWLCCEAAVVPRRDMATEVEFLPKTWG